MQDKIKAVITEEFSDFNIEDVECESRDGFIPFTDGGVTATRFVHLSSLWISGRRFGVKAVDKELDDRINSLLNGARAEFDRQYPECKGLSYNQLYLSGRKVEAEELSEFESAWFDDESVMLEFGVYLYNSGNYHNRLNR
jgi:hypothetical protein